MGMYDSLASLIVRLRVNLETGMLTYTVAAVILIRSSGVSAGQKLADKFPRSRVHVTHSIAEFDAI
jgi:hypothetical protein